MATVLGSCFMISSTAALLVFEGACLLWPQASGVRGLGPEFFPFLTTVLYVVSSAEFLVTF